MYVYPKKGTSSVVHNAHNVQNLCKMATQTDKTKILMTNGNLMKVESIAEMLPLEHSAILLTCIK